MTDLAALVAAVKDRPDDDTPRLVLADYYADHGGEAGEHHAAFIRGSIENARSDGVIRQRDRWPGRGTKLPQMFDPIVWDNRTPVPATHALTNAAGTGVAWHRGCVEMVSAPFGAWLAVGHAAVRGQPVRFVHIHGRSVTDPGRPVVNWYLAGAVPNATHAVAGYDGRIASDDVLLTCGPWVVRLPWNTGRDPMHQYDWAGFRLYAARVFLESAFPGVRFLVTGQSPILRYPDPSWMEADGNGGVVWRREWPEPVGREEWVVRRPEVEAAV